MLDIFEKNFSDGDAKLITDAVLASKPDKDDIDHFGLSITSIAEKNKTNELKDIPELYNTAVTVKVYV